MEVNHRNINEKQRRTTIKSNKTRTTRNRKKNEISDFQVNHMHCEGIYEKK